MVTDRGVAVNPRRGDLEDRLTAAYLPVSEISGSRETAEKAAGTRRLTAVGDNIVAVVEYRDGTIIDVVRQVAI